MIWKQLKLDVFVLQAWKRSNMCAHGHTLYYRRVSMVLQALERYQVVGGLSSGDENASSMLSHTPQSSKSNEETTTAASEAWTNYPKRKSRGVSHEKAMMDQGKLLHHMPELLSRIEWAARALALELARGFFLPVCSVAVAALARIYYILDKTGAGRVTTTRKQGGVVKRQYNDLQLLQRSLGLCLPRAIDRKSAVVTLKEKALDGISDADEGYTTHDRVVANADGAGPLNRTKPNGPQALDATGPIQMNDIGESVGFAVSALCDPEAKARSSAQHDEVDNVQRGLLDKLQSRKQKERKKSDKAKTKVANPCKRKQKQSRPSLLLPQVEGDPVNLLNPPVHHAKKSKKKKKKKRSHSPRDAIDDIFGD